MTDDAAERGGPAGAGGATPHAPADPGPTTNQGYDQPPAPPPAPEPAFASRYGLVRPREERYLAGVCAAIGRATNTDPVLWRVLFAVLGFFGGIGILAYVTAWLIIPAEGDTASPVESMLGRGHSSMSPVTAIALSILVAVMFGFIVSDEFRAVLLGAAILVGGALLINRKTAGPRLATPPGTSPPGTPHPSPPTANPPAAPATPGTSAPPSPAWPAPAVSAPPRPVSEPPPGSYRAPFAPHGPYAATPPHPPGPFPPGAVPPRPPRPPRPRKPARERSPLGAATFSTIFLVVGLVAILDLAHVVSIGPSAYFAGALATIALGLLVGTWFGRARWLIALGLVTAAALGVSTVVESYDRLPGRGSEVVWAPAGYEALASRYHSEFGDARLDLTGVDFTGKDAVVTVSVNFGKLEVLVPPDVDVRALTDVNVGDATVFGHQWSGVDGPTQQVTDLGANGAGGGDLRLYLHVNVGDAEVRR